MPNPRRVWTPQVSMTCGGDQDKVWAHILRCQESSDYNGQWRGPEGQDSRSPTFRGLSSGRDHVRGISIVINVRPVLITHHALF